MFWWITEEKKVKCPTGMCQICSCSHWKALSNHFWFWPWFTKAILNRIVVGSPLSFVTPSPALASLPPLTRCFYVLPPLIHNGMSHALKRPLSWVHFSVRVFLMIYVPKSCCLLPPPLLHCLPTRPMIMIIRVLCQNYCEIPSRQDSHQRVFFSMGLCTTVVCVEAVRRAPALIRHK